MNTLLLSGWGQPPDALAHIIPQAQTFDYAALPSLESALAALQQYTPDLAIGWSQGAQMLLRAIDAGVIVPKALVLIAAPYQFLQDGHFPHGMGRETFAQYRDNFMRASSRTFNKSYSLIAHNDTREEHVRAHLDAARAKLSTGYDWLYWLDEIAGFSCRDVDLTRMPPALLIHGTEDVVSSPRQSQMLAEKLPRAKLELWQGAGHAPHWHDEQRLRATIKQFTESHGVAFV